MSDISAIEARWVSALDAKPSKGSLTLKAVQALIDSACDVPDLLKEVYRLRSDLEKVRDWVNRRGVYVGDEGSEWWDGYRQAEREVMLSAHDLACSLETAGEVFDE